MVLRNFKCASCGTINRGDQVCGDKTRYEVPSCPRCGCFDGTPTEEPITPRTVDANGHADFGRPATHFKEKPETLNEPAAAQTPSPALPPPAPGPSSPASASIAAPARPPAAIAVPEVIVKYDIGVDVKTVTGIEPGKAYLIEIEKCDPQRYKRISSNIINLGNAIGVKFIVIPLNTIVSIRGVQK